MGQDARLELRVPGGLLVRVDAVRGDVSRSVWVRRAVEAALGSDSERSQDESPKTVRGPASPPPSGVSRADAFRAAGRRQG